MHVSAVATPALPCPRRETCESAPEQPMQASHATQGPLPLQQKRCSGSSYDMIHPPSNPISTVSHKSRHACIARTHTRTQVACLESSSSCWVPRLTPDTAPWSTTPLLEKAGKRKKSDDTSCDVYVALPRLQLLDWPKVSYGGTTGQSSSSLLSSRAKFAEVAGSVANH